MFDSEDVPTMPYPALAEEPSRPFPLPGLPPVVTPAPPGDDAFGVALEELTIEDEEPPTRLLSVSLPVGADEAYELFCNGERIHEWMTVVRSSKVIARTPTGKPKRTAFIAQLERSSMGYTLHYEYDEAHRSVRWSSGPASSMRITGHAFFTKLSDTACMMHYELDMRATTQLPAWDDPMYNGHPASSVLCDFREFVMRRWG